MKLVSMKILFSEIEMKIKDVLVNEIFKKVSQVMPISIYIYFLRLM